MSDVERNDVLEVLYGEDGDESRLDETGRAELAKWRELRGVMREVGDASMSEPPDTIGILMAAARERVPEKRGLLDRMKAWLGVMVAHPAMSAAATVVVVAGVAGVLYVRGAVKSDVKERAEKDHAGEQTVAAGSGSGSAAGSGSAVVAYGAEIPKNDIAIPAPVIDEPTPEKEKIKPPEEKAPARPAHHGAPAPKPTTGSASGRMGGDVDGLVAAQQDEGEAVTVDDRDASKTPVTTTKTQTTTEAPPPPPPPPAPAADTAGAPAPERRHDLDPAILTQQARAAAKKKDCKTVEQLATRVIQLNEGYYRANFAPDTTIRANCDAATRK